MTLETILERNRFTHFLLDASGVLYTDHGPTSNISSTVRRLQEQGHVYIATNNSSFSPRLIVNKLKRIDIHTDEDHILSSGLGLSHDPRFHDQIKDKLVYVFGLKESLSYVTRTAFKAIVSHPDLADTIILTSSFKNPDDTRFDQLVMSLKKRPRPILCCNPDQKVIGKKGFYYVIGFYAIALAQETNLPIQWFGKPYSNYSWVIKSILEKRHPTIDFNNVFFCDDNLANVRRLQSDLNLYGCWITKSGISHLLDPQEAIQQLGAPSSVLDKLAFENK